MLAAEEAKKRLSVDSSAELENMEFGLDPEERDSFDLRITRSDFERSIRPLADKSVDLVNQLLTRCRLRPADLAFALFVGGSTYIPLIRQRVAECLGIDVRHDIDPVSAIAVGAAYFAGTRIKEIPSAPMGGGGPRPRLAVKVAYARTSLETTEIFAARVDGDVAGLWYRIEREDHGWDSGRKRLTERINEDLPLVRDCFNVFRLLVLDDDGNPVSTDVGDITIAQGVEVLGPPLPHPICLAHDDVAAQEVCLHEVFKRGTKLKASRRIEVETTRSLAKGRDENMVLFQVCENEKDLPREAWKPIGELVIEGRHLTRDLRKGDRITCRIEMNESRELSILAEIEMTDQRFQQAYNQRERTVTRADLFERAIEIEDRLDDAMSAANEQQAYERSEQIKALQRRLRKAKAEVEAMPDDDRSDRKYQLEDEFRAIATEHYRIDGPRQVEEKREQLAEALEQARQSVEEGGNDLDRRRLEDARRQAAAARSRTDPHALRVAIDQLNHIHYGICWRTPDFLVRVFQDLSTDYHSRFNDAALADQLLQAGKQAVENEDWMRLQRVNFDLIDLLPDLERGRFPGETGIRVVD